MMVNEQVNYIQLYPPGVVRYGEEYVTSQPIKVDGCNSTCFIRGRFDIVIEFNDKSYGVIDFKTGYSKEENNKLYARQLHAYAYALEHPAPGAMALFPVTKLGLLYFYPVRTDQRSVEKLSYESDIQWVEMKKSEQGFLDFAKEALSILDSPKMPEPSRNCDWCNYYAHLAIKKIRAS